MIIHITGSNKKNRKLVKQAAQWYAEKLMGKRLMNSLKINIYLRRNLITKEGNEGTAIWEDDYCDRPREFTIELDLSFSIRDVLITLAHEMVHIKQWARGEMYEYTKSPMVRFHTTKFELDDINYWDYPWEIEAFGKQLGLFIRFCEDVGIADDDEMQEGVK